MRKFHGWKLVARDALFVYIIYLLLGTLLSRLWEMPVPPSSKDIWLRVALGLSIGIFAFGVVGVSTKELMWKHLLKISGILLIFSFCVNIVQFKIQMPRLDPIMIFNAIWSPFVQHSITSCFGSIFASAIRKLKGQSCVAS